MTVPRAKKTAGAAKRRPGQQANAVAVPPPDVQMDNETAVRAHWDDPTDTGRTENYLRRGQAYVRQVHGYRRADPILALHRRNPEEVTKLHVQAAERLRDDMEIGAGISTGGKGGGGDVGPTDAMIDAAARFRAACDAVGRSMCTILLPVVLDGWTVKQWTEARPKRDRDGKVVVRNGKPVPSLSEERASGYLLAALARLHDHYNPPVHRRQKPIDPDRIGLAGTHHVGSARPEAR